MAELTPEAADALRRITRRRAEIVRVKEREQILFEAQVGDYARAREAGATYQQIADADGVSAIFVSRRINDGR